MPPDAAATMVETMGNSHAAVIDDSELYFVLTYFDADYQTLVQLLGIFTLCLYMTMNGM